MIALPYTSGLTHDSMPAARVQLLTFGEAKLLLVVLAFGTAGMVLLGTAAPTFLWWNLLLAWVPLGIQRALVALAPRYGLGLAGRFTHVLTWCAWLLFLPNAPYLVTDYVHPLSMLARGESALVLSSFAYVTCGMLLGLGWYYRSLAYGLEGLARYRFWRKLHRHLRYALTLAVATGVWLGRSLRFNTWDVLTRPVDLVNSSYAYLTDVAHVELIVATAVLLELGYRGWSWWTGRVLV